MSRRTFAHYLDNDQSKCRNQNNQPIAEGGEDVGENIEESLGDDMRGEKSGGCVHLREKIIEEDTIQ